MAKGKLSPGISPAKKNEYSIEAGQILMQNIQERLTGLLPAAGVLQGLQLAFQHLSRWDWRRP